MDPNQSLSNFILLPELKLTRTLTKGRFTGIYECQKHSKLEICPKCATPSQSTYDSRRVKIKDSPVRGHKVVLVIKKRRFWCKPCGKPFTEPVQGVIPRRRTTQRYRSGVLWACENFSDLKRVKKAFQCSDSFLYGALYEQLELKRRTRQYPWPKAIGIDEHAFKRAKNYGGTQFASMIVDMKNKRLMEVVEGKTQHAMKEGLSEIPGRENVKEVALDLCDPYKSFVKDFFPNAKITADKFHVLRLLNPAINRERRLVTGDRRTLRIRKLLLANSKNLDYFTRSAIWRWLEDHPKLKELYRWKEGIHGFYRIRGYDRALKAFTRMTDEMAKSKIKEIKTFRKTLLKWKNEILNYFKTRLTNARTEGFNNRAKLLKRRAYGYKSFRNYRLRLLNTCSG